MTDATTTTAGIDISKAWLDMAIHGSAGHRRFVNAGCGWRALATELTATGVERVGIDATGGYERGVAKHLRAHDDLARRLNLVLSIPGIGERTAIALAGLAPFDADNGAHKAQRHIAGGRARVRRSLFAAAPPAAFHWNQPLIAFYARLTARGKSHTATLVACPRKLLIYANTVVSRQTPWTEKVPAT